MTDSSVVATVQFSSEKSCYVQTNLQDVSTLGKSDQSMDLNVVKIVTDNHSVSYFGLSPQRKGIDKQNKVLYVNGLYGSKNRIQNSSQVSVEFMHNIPACIEAWIEPVSVDDWEILELHSEQIESSLMDQIRVVWVGQVFPLWVDGNICIFLKTSIIEPASHCGILMPLTKLVVQPKVNNHLAYEDERQLSSLRPVKTGSNQNDLDDQMEVTSQVSSVSQPEQNESMLQWLYKVSFVRRIYQLIRYVLRMVWNRIAPFLRSTLGIFKSHSNIKGHEHFSIGISDQVLSSINNFPDKLDMILRVEPMSDSESIYLKPFNSWNQQGSILLHASSYDARISNQHDNTDSGMFLVCMQKLPSPKELEKLQEHGKVDTNKSTKEFLVRLNVQPLSRFSMMFHNENRTQYEGMDLQACTLKVSSHLRRQLSISVSSRVRISKVKTVPKCVSNSVKKIVFRVLNDSVLHLEEKKVEVLHLSLRSWLLTAADPNCPVPVTVDTFLSFPLLTSLSLEEIRKTPYSIPEGVENLNVDVVIDSFVFEEEENSDCHYYLLSPADLKNIEVEFNFPAPGDDRNIPDLDEIDHDVPQVSAETLVTSHQALLADCFNHAKIVLRSCSISSRLTGRLNSLQPGCLLVTGSKGVGKSTLCQALLRKLAYSTEYYAYVLKLSCSSLRGKKPETVKKLLFGLFSELEWRQPSVLFLDDIDHLVPNCLSPDSDRSPDASYSLQLAAILKDFLLTVCGGKNIETCRGARTKNRVLVVSTAASQLSVHPYLQASHGCHLFTKNITMELPGGQERMELLRSIIVKRTDIDVQTFSFDTPSIKQATEGYSAKDLIYITERAIHSYRSRVRRNDMGSILSAEDYQTALAGYVPQSLQETNLCKPRSSSWSDVGGLSEVRSQLMEKLVWPIKYDYLYKTAGIQLQSGMMLFGPPGCGKTLLASVVANECGLNFISVKGPELLSKYIGASEAAVRDLFSRASSAAPCILFFDEFDSIAQRRGHDSTGVTDRVVNQILTHLDGVEALDGVHVLAATSRPDLIDPALLRPGRIDTHLHCPLPDFKERCSILETLVAKLPTSDNINVRYFAEKCENFTGADLRALVYDAQLKALHMRQDISHSIRDSSNALEEGIKSDNKHGDEQSLLYPEYTSSLPSKYQICFDLSREISDENLEQESVNQKTIHGTRTTESKDNEEILYFPSIYGKNDTLPDDVARLVSAVDHTLNDSTKICNEKFEVHESAKQGIAISNHHLELALSAARPSVSENERKRYLEICRTFVGNSQPSDHIMIDFRNQRATLA